MNKSILLSVALVIAASTTVEAQVGSDNPTGVSGQFGDRSMTGCLYDPYTGNATRVVTDMTIAGGIGAYPLSFRRYANSRTAVASNFGYNNQCPGGWQHSCAWSMGNSGDLSDTPITVNFPDGRAIQFNTATGDAYYRGPAGVKERFQPFATGTNLGYLIFTDGGKVEFKRTQAFYIDGDTGQRVYYYTYQAQALVDPFGQRTTFTYTGAGRFQKATDPGGHWIQVTYSTLGTDAVISSVSGSDGRSISYSYTSITNGGGTHYNALDHVTYFGDSTLVAHYTYANANVGPTYAIPVLKTCDDPMYAGPMRRVGYVYQTANNPDGSLAVYGQIQSENYYNGTTIGAAVASLVVNGSTRTETRGDGPTRTFTYTGYKLTAVTDFKNKTENRAYDTKSFIKSVTNRNNNQTLFSSDPLSGLITQTTFPLTSNDTPPGTPAGVVKVTYGSATCPDPNNRDVNNPYYVYSTTDEGNHSTVYTRDTSKRVTRIDYPDGGFETFSYNSFGEILAHQLRTGGNESFTYDAAGMKQTYRNPSNATGNPTARYSYDSMNRRSVTTDALGTTTGDINHSVGCNYNSRGQLTITTLPVDPVDGVQHTITNAYNTNGDGTLISVTDQLSHVTSYTYDDYRRVLTKTTPQRFTGDSTPRVANFYYDANGTGNDYTHTDSNVTHVTAPAGDKAVTVYDNNHRKTSVTVASGTSDVATTSFGYDNVGNSTSGVAPNEQAGQLYAGQSTITAYDARNRVMSTTDPLGHLTSCTYDAAGRKASATRANGQITTFDSYDAMNRLLQQTVKQTPDPDAVTKYTYYTSGLLHTMQDPMLVANASSDNYFYSYDTTGRKTGLTYPLDSHGAHTSEAWHYDTAGRNDTFTNRNGKIETITYDGLNRITGTSWNDSGLTPSVTTTYDAASRLKTIVNANATISRTYLNDNLLNTETSTYADSTPRTVTYTYDADGNRATILYPNSAYGFTYGYTNRNQLHTISSTSGGANVITYQYDPDGNLSMRTPANGTHSTYIYDGLDRVTNIAHLMNGTTRTFDYGYDSVSNRSWTKRDGANGDVFGYDVNDQSTSVLLDVASPDTTSPGAQTIAYDANGNRTTFSAYGPTDTYMPNNLNQYSSRNSSNAIYDPNGNTTTALDSSGYTYDSQNRLLTAAKGSSSDSFEYDGLSRQVSRTTGSGLIYNVYDGWSLIGEYQAAANTPQTAYVFGPGGLVKLAGSSGTFYYMQDASQCTSHLSDSSGNLAEWYRYDLHGTPFVYDSTNTLRSGGTAYGIRHLFNGQQWYSDVALYDLRNRFYSPDSGRFLQADPTGFDGDPANLYRYCSNNPLRYQDPTGTISIIPGFSISNGSLNYPGVCTSYGQNSIPITGDNGYLVVGAIAGGAVAVATFPEWGTAGMYVAAGTAMGWPGVPYALEHVGEAASVPSEVQDWWNEINTPEYDNRPSEITPTAYPAEPDPDRPPDAEPGPAPTPRGVYYMTAQMGPPPGYMFAYSMGSAFLVHAGFDSLDPSYPFQADGPGISEPDSFSGGAVMAGMFSVFNPPVPREQY